MMLHRFLLCLCVLLLIPVLPVSAAEQPTLQVSVANVGLGKVPKGAQRVSFLQLTIKASCTEDVQIHAIRLRHKGKGLASDIEGVYAMLNNKRVSDVRTISNRDARLQLRLRNVTIEACKTAVMTIVADFAATASSGAEHVLLIEHDSDIDAGDAIIVLGNGSSTSSTVQTVPGTTGTVNATFLPLLKPPRFGVGKTVARLTLEAKEKNQRPISIVFTNEGSASDNDLQNLSLETASGEKITDTASSLDGRTVTLQFLPTFTLPKNGSKMVYLVADVKASRKKTIRLILDEPSDLLTVPASRR